MKYRNAAALVIIGALTFFGMGVVHAEEKTEAKVDEAKVDYAAEIKKHAEEGIAQGKQGHMDILEQHAREALKAAKLGMEYSSGDTMAYEMEVVANRLRKAITQAKEGQADAAIKLLEEAIAIFGSKPPYDPSQP